MPTVGLPGTRKKRAVTECCCRGCVGCCFTVQEDPYRVLDVPWEVSAPNCPEIDGVTGILTSVDPTSPVRGPCGPCNTWCNIGPDYIELTGISRVPIDGVCTTTPCSLGQMCMVMECNEQEVTIPEMDPCCSRVRMWLGLTLGANSILNGDDGSRPSASCGQTCTTWVKIAPSSCSCEGGTLSAIFNISGLTINCATFTDGPCAGEPVCCQINCDLSGATIAI